MKHRVGYKYIGVVQKVVRTRQTFVTCFQIWNELPRTCLHGVQSGVRYWQLTTVTSGTFAIQMTEYVRRTTDTTMIFLHAPSIVNSTLGEFRLSCNKLNQSCPCVGLAGLIGLGWVGSKFFSFQWVGLGRLPKVPQFYEKTIGVDLDLKVESQYRDSESVERVGGGVGMGCAPFPEILFIFRS